MLHVQSSEFLLHRLHQRFRETQRRARFARPAFSRAKSADPRKELAGLVEHQARAILEAMGYQVARCGYNCGWDLWVDGAKVEVKAATYSGGRYQANTSRNCGADLVLLGCQTPSGALEWFVIPGEVLGDVKTVSVWTADPADHNGRWCEFFSAWWWVDAITQRVPSHRGWQSELPLQEAGNADSVELTCGCKQQVYVTQAESKELLNRPVICGDCGADFRPGAICGE